MITLPCRPIYAAAAAQASDGQQVPVYKVGPNDTLTISVFGAPELSGPVPVRPDGDISIPLVPDIPVVGRTTAEISTEISARLSHFINEPRVSVSVIDGKGTYGDRIRVFGEGNTPQSLQYRQGMTVLDALTAASTDGTPGRGLPDHVTIYRQDGDTLAKVPVDLSDLSPSGSAHANPVLQPGDMIFVQHGLLDGRWRVKYSALFNATYTDNVDLRPGGQRDNALILQTGPQINIEGKGDRFSAGVTGQILGEQRLFTRSRQQRIDTNVDGYGHFEVVPNEVLFDTAASVAQLRLNSQTPESASGSNTSNLTTVQTYRISPSVLHRFGDFATLQTRYTGDATLSDSSLSNSFTNTLSANLDSGLRFDRLNWGLAVSGSDETRTSASDVKTASAIATVSYPILNGLRLVGRAGYQTYSDGLSIDRKSDPVWSVGFHWAPSPKTDVSASAGEAYGSPTFNLDATHKLTERTTVNAYYHEEVATGQAQLAANLPNSLSALTNFNPQPSDLSLVDVTTTMRTLGGGLQTTLGRDTYRLQGDYETSTQGVGATGTPDERIYKVELGWDRALSSLWTLSSDATYRHSSFSDGSHLNDILASTKLTYLGFRRISVSLGYYFTRRIAENTPTNESYYENAVMLSGVVNF